MSADPRRSLTLNPLAGTCVGVAIGLGYIQMIVADVSHAIIADKNDADGDPDYSPEVPIEVVQKLMRRGLRQNSMSMAGLLRRRRRSRACQSDRQPRPARERVSPPGRHRDQEGLRLRSAAPDLCRPTRAIARRLRRCLGRCVGYSDFVLFRSTAASAAPSFRATRITGIAGGGGEFGAHRIDPDGDSAAAATALPRVYAS